MIEEEKSKLAETHKRRILTSLYHCLIPLLRDIGWYGSKEQLNQILPMENFSINIDDVRNSLTALRIITKTKFIRLNKIKGSNLPCIFTTKEGNSITIFEINEYGFSVFDGYTQKRQVIKPNWKKGSMLTFDLLDDNATTLQESQTKWFNKLIIRFQQMFGYSLFLSLAISILTVSAPLFVMFLFREISALEVTSTLDQLAVGVAFYVLTLVGFRILRTINLAYFSARIGNIIANQVMRRLLYLPPTYTEMASLGAQLSRIRDFDSIKNFFF